MTLYLGFAGDSYYPSGGMADYKFTDTDKASALARWGELSLNNWWHIVEVPSVGEPVPLMSGQEGRIDPTPQLY